ncbi:uncharacterized protein N7458_004373 [Penicillium daleae]|uniref:BZIP domain-containing protein n=1 Tax=Penicillium daleae TaxID=63821 RepID=A0AAD6G3D0_9EURO|nr:uncharacterized protein N7458_004373 [Penicillium daleae]KAJ5453417.1 hypothetical protein N7458_004373 [Penicillium daleae]
MSLEMKGQNKLDVLARVRENQRKQRSRKREYVQEMEQQLVALQKETRRTDVQNRIALQKMAAENQQLKSLLLLLGFSAFSAKQHLQWSDKDSTAGRKVAIPVMERPTGANSLPSLKTACSSPSQVMFSVTSEEDDSVKQPPLNDNVQPTSIMPTHESAEQQQTYEISSSCNRMTEPHPLDRTLFNTTPFSVADKLLAQYNARGVDMDELRHRICPGFEETELACCRVSNKMLFQILDEISY